MTDPNPANHLRSIGSTQLFWTLATNVAMQGCTVAQGVALARLLGPTGRGDFAAAILWPTLFASVGLMGLNVSLGRRAARPSDRSCLVRTGLLLSSVTGLFSCVCCAALLPWLLPRETQLFNASYVFLPFVLFNHVSLAMISIDQGSGNFAKFNLTRLMLNPVHLCILLFLWIFQVRDLFMYTGSLVAANAIVAFTRVWFSTRGSLLLGPVIAPMSIAKESLPFALTNVCSPLLQQLDKILILYLLGTWDLGIYSVALSAASIVNIIASSSGSVVFGISAQAKQSAGFERVAKMFRATALMWLGGGIVLAAILPLAVPLVYGKSFGASVVPAQLLIPAAGVAGLASVLEQALRAQGKPFVGLAGRLLGIALMIVVSLYLVPKIRMFGLVAAYTVAEAFFLIVLVTGCRRHYRCDPRLLLPGRNDILQVLRGTMKRIRELTISSS